MFFFFTFYFSNKGPILVIKFSCRSCVCVSLFEFNYMNEIKV